jgi:ketosteroid isomerase-like protein
VGLRDFSRKYLTKEIASGIIDLSKEREVNKMTIEEMHKEAAAVIESYFDDLIFYMTEYQKIIGHEKIAEIFSTEYSKAARQIAKELKEES